VCVCVCVCVCVRERDRGGEGRIILNWVRKILLDCEDGRRMEMTQDRV
jgi:hypothetical protein